jgi:hypothetical protein
MVSKMHRLARGRCEQAEALLGVTRGLCACRNPEDRPMNEQPERQSASDDRKPLTEGLPQFPAEAESTPLAPSPSRASLWGWTGFWWGAALGGVCGIPVLTLSLIADAPSLGEALGIFVSLPLLLGGFLALVFAFRGAVQDHILESHELAQQREAERREEQDRDWHGVKQLLKRKNDDHQE